MLYTTVFGWYATWVFCWTGRLLPAIAVHAFCNLMGVPPFGEMAADGRSLVWAVLTVAGIAGFAWLLQDCTAGWQQQQYTSVYSQHALSARA
jgi:prenyl protein peptidase